MLEKGTVVYFLMNGYVMSGKVFDISGNNDNYEFSIEGYAGCAGSHIISSSQMPKNQIIGKSFFMVKYSFKFKNIA